MEESDTSSEVQQVPIALTALHITAEERGSHDPWREDKRLDNPLQSNDGENVSQSISGVPEFQAKIEKFVSEHGDMLDKVISQDSKEGGGAMRVPTLHNYQGEDTYKYAEPDALEFHMRVDSQIRTRRFFELVTPGDVIEGHVTSKYTAFRSLSVQVTSFIGSHKFRELADLNIQGRVSFDNLSDENKEREKIFDEMQLMDVIQGVVISCQDSVLSLSFKESHVKEFCPSGELPVGALLGYRSGKVPKREMQRGSLDDFLRNLEDDPGFGNPSCTDNLKVVLGIGTGTAGTEPLEIGMRPTLLRDIQMADYPRGDYHQALRKVQRGKWSMETVELGVEAFKAGDNVKAMAMLCHALGIDPENVEGLVARGALYANGGRFKEAIRDFERALTVKHTHRNARKYLVETQVAYGEQLEKKGQSEEAMRCYREALADDPGQTVARERLEHLTMLAEKQEAERREQERKKVEDEKTLRKIQKFLDREREKESRKTAKKAKLSKKKNTKPAKKQKRRSSGSSKHTTKRSRRDSKQYSSSDSESTYSDTSRSESARSRSRSYSSDESSPHRKRKHHSGKSQKRRSRSSRSRSRTRCSSYSSDRSSHYRKKHGHQTPRKSRRGRSSSSTFSENSPLRSALTSYPRNRAKRSSSSHKASSSERSRKTQSPKRSKRTDSPRKKRRSESSRSPASSYKTSPTRRSLPSHSTRKSSRSPSLRKRRRTDSFKSSRSSHRSSLDSNSPSKGTSSKTKPKGH